MTTLPQPIASPDVAFRSLLGSNAEVATMLGLEGAVTQGHYRLLSGSHTDRFLAFSAVASDVSNLDRIAGWLGPTVDAWRADAVISPSTAGVGLGSTLARRISAPLYLASVGPDGRPTHVIGSSMGVGTRVLIVNDVATTGTSIRGLVDLVASAGAVVAGAAWFASRSLTPVTAFEFPTAHIVDVDLPTSQADACVLCADTDDRIVDATDLN
ncbi:phosphoribosyltransferase family protein [Nocardioides sp. SOB77]|uniref:Phosphoribosyltransferase family protein n=1 Tax=Nocardioides oceani TaxID=3058369 RepID=A0ABT8FLT0_9ACTN|nr:phosphoribosyltransferase family protein [Nocardioides oceani]MDN4175628.1 phosphoribosyltransferase family protein [Nocardioides oceani]